MLTRLVAPIVVTLTIPAPALVYAAPQPAKPKKGPPAERIPFPFTRVQQVNV